MKFFNLILIGWIFKQVTAEQYNESISFSSNHSPITVPSYWHDSINFPQHSSLIEQGINVQLHLNEFQGLLFYAIDNYYRTIWVEFAEENIEINYYNFSINQSKKYSIKITNICISKTSNKVNLNFLSRNNQIEIICNNNSIILEFLNSTDDLPTGISDSFLESFPLPIPQFDSTKDPRVYLWIGNTPSVINKTLYRNKILTSNPKNLFGCIQWFAINNIFLKLASTGGHYGDLISRFCQPVCNPNPCYNNGKCVELWRKQYFCDCKQTYFLGKHCDLEYSIRFDGSFSFGDFVNFNFTKLKFSFIYYKNYISGKKAIIFLELSRNESFLIYISETDYIHAKFIDRTFSVPERKLPFMIIEKKRYIVFVEVITGDIQVKISDFEGYDEVDIMLPVSRNDLIINHIDIGNYNFPEKGSAMFRGCFTNLALISESKEYIWNEMKNFSNYPSCNEFIKTTSQTKFISTRRTTTFFKKENVTFLTVPSTKPKENNNLIYIIIGSIIGVIILISVILVILKYGFKKKLRLEKPNENNTAEYRNDRDSIRHLQTFPSDIGTPKKPFRSKRLKERELALDATDSNNQNESTEQSSLTNFRDEIAV